LCSPQSQLLRFGEQGKSPTAAWLAAPLVATYMAKQKLVLAASGTKQKKNREAFTVTGALTLTAYSVDVILLISSFTQSESLSGYIISFQI